MSRGSGLISIWLSFSILLLSAGLVSHVMSIPLLLGAAQRDAWVSVLVATPFFLLWLVLLFAVLKQLQGQRIPDWIARHFGVIPAWIFRLSAFIVLFLSGTYTLHDTSMWTVVTYMQQTPMQAIVLIAVVTSMLAAYGGLRTIAMTSSVLLPIVILLGYFVATANTKYKDLSLLFPILERGWQPVWHGAFFAFGGLLELWILILFQHQLRSKLRLWQLILLGLFMITMAIGPTIGAISEFGPIEAAKQRHTAFDQWKIVNIGKLLQHVDFLSIYQWLCGSFARVSIALYLMTDMLDVRKPRSRFITLLVLTTVMTVVAMQLWRDDQTLDYLMQIHFPITVVFVGSITILLALAVLYRRSRKESSTDDASKAKTSK